MKRVKSRSLAVIILSAALVAGLALYVVKFFISGSTWASSKINQGVYSSGALAYGTVTDRNGVVLAGVSDGERVFAEDKTLRRATLHAVGDKEGNIGTGALKIFTSELIGYNPVTGIYSRTGEGGTVKLSIDSDLNVTAYEALGGRSGAVIVLNYETGEIVCMVSTPTFDPQNPSEVELDSPKYDGVYLNRAISASYTPGSVFKIVTAAAAFENIADIDTRAFTCSGRLTVGEGDVTCPSAHGTLGFKDALAHSCNIAFAELALELGAETLFEYAENFGLIARHEVDGIKTAAGSFGIAPDGSFELAWSGAGQSVNLCSPVSMARLTAAIANDGKSPSLTFKCADSPLFGSSKSTRIMKSSTAAALKDMMKYNVEESYGSSSFPGLSIYAKSGTAEVGTGLEPHAWFVGFIDNEDAPLAFAVIVENGGWGRAVAGDIANKVMQKAVSN